MAFDLAGKAIKNLRMSAVNYSNSHIEVVPQESNEFIGITLFDDRGDICLSPYSSVILCATLPDGNLYTEEGEILKKENVAICQITGGILSQIGRVSCDVRLSGKDCTGAAISLTSQTFYLLVTNSNSDK